MDQPTISIHKNGKWYWGEVEMFRRNIIKILARNIVRENDGSYFIAMGQEKQALIVEDVPFYATGIHVNEEGRLVLTFHDLQEMVLDKTLQLFRKGNVPYITFRWPADTRLSRGLYWKLSEYFVLQEDPEQQEPVYIVPPEKAQL